MKLLRRSIVIARIDCSIAQPLRPIMPGGFRLIAYRAKRGVFLYFRALAQKTLELSATWRSFRKEQGCQQLEHLAPRRPLRLVIDDFIAPEFAELSLKRF